jgi:hypothetical protein
MLPDDMPADFTSDGCTGFFNTWRGIDLLPCCTAHDLAWHNSPGDWIAWATSNLELGVCFVSLGAWELALPAVLAVFTVGAFLFSRKRQRP